MTTTLSIAAYDLTCDALAIAGVIDVDEPPTGAQIQRAYRTLNIKIKQLQTQGPNLWRLTEGCLFLQPGVSSYSLPGAPCCVESDLAYTTSQLGASSGLDAFPVASIIGFEVGDFVGVELSTGVRQWSTIVSFPGNNIQMQDVLQASVLAGATVYGYTDNIDRPVRITDARRIGYQTQSSTVPVDIVSRQEWKAQPNKLSRGKTVMAYYDPQIGVGALSVWPAPDSCRDTFRFTFERPFAIIVENSDLLDLPEEQLEAFKYQLAERFCDDFNVPDSRKASVRATRIEVEEKSQAFDQEDASIQFQPSGRWYGR